MRAKSYKVIHGPVESGAFERMVQEQLDHSWSLYGSPFFTTSKIINCVIGHQAVVLYDKSPEQVPNNS